ncbi:HEAT repeat domain-containing protein [Dyella monticola]|uniref:HEAT repeat domain-containing protein n=2 Tax=Dyella monticola TaxID=1927958 RepID=A0A370X3E6_9GAMM|nr:HEAT repeat domain-containing protein [Dyella monticola]
MALIIIDEFVRSHPIVSEIEARADSEIPFNFASERVFLTKIAESGLAQYAVRQALIHASKSDDFQLSNFSMTGSIQLWTLLVTNLFAMNIVIRDPSTDAQNIGNGSRPSFRIQPYASDVFIHTIKADGALLHQYRTGEAGAPPSLVKSGQQKLANGVSMLIPAMTQAVSFETEDVLITLEIIGPTKQTVLPMFDSDSLRLSGYISTDPTASRLELLTYTLAEFRDVESFEQIAALTDHREHYVRWNAARHLLRIDPSRARHYVEKALGDTHEEVRDAAQTTMKLFFS